MRSPDRDASDLRSYVSAKHAVADVVRRVLTLLPTDVAQDRSERAHELIVKLAEDRFNLAVVGQFKRGKSTLMNAIIGRDLLPTGLLPLTSAITALFYGPRETVTLRREGWGLEQEITARELADYVAEQGNPGNEKGLIEARIELPVRFLRRGLYFIHTPGIGSARRENTASTYAFLPQADAIIFVTSVDAPLSEVEGGFLEDIREYATKLFVVVSKMDLVRPDEQHEMLAYVRARCSEILDSDEVEIYPVSAREALDGKRARDEVAIRKSGLPAFEAALTSFLANEQGRAFLVGILTRTLPLIADDTKPSNSASDEDTGPDANVAALRERIAAIRTQLQAGAGLSVVRSNAEPTLTDSNALPDRVVAAQSAPHGERRASTRRRSICTICTEQTEAVFAFFANWQNELVTNTSARHAFATAQGFCSVHTWQFAQIASPQSLSVGYLPLIEASIENLERLPGEAPAPLAAVEGCAACQVIRNTGAAAISQCVATLAAEGRDDVEPGDGLCLPHLHAVLASDPAGSSCTG